MELAFVLLFVLLGTGAILYAGMRRPPARPEPAPENADGNTASPSEGPPPAGDADANRL